MFSGRGPGPAAPSVLDPAPKSRSFLDLPGPDFPQDETKKQQILRVSPVFTPSRITDKKFTLQPFLILLTGLFPRLS